MKKTCFSLLVILCVTLIISIIPTEAEGAIYEDTVRLHILANSDTKEDQELKLKIRDDVLAEFSDRLSELENAESAKDKINSLLDKITQFCKERISEYGYDYDVSAELTNEWYDTREYENFTLPCGYYSSLKIIIGNGAGKNWWCVMFPPLCLDIATEKSPSDDAVKKYNNSEFVLVSGKGYRVKFKILEMMSEVFS